MVSGNGGTRAADKGLLWAQGALYGHNSTPCTGDSRPWPRAGNILIPSSCT